MIRELALLLLILISLQVLIRFTLYEGFSSKTRLDHRKQWEKLSDDQVLELLGVLWGSLILFEVIDYKNDPNVKEVASDISAICRPIINSESDKVFKNQSDINTLKNKIKNKAAADKNLSILFNIADSYSNDMLKLGKRIHKAQINNDITAVQAGFEDVKALAKKGISEIRRKVPKFPFNPQIIKEYPELFAETPKPTATECKRYFKCSSIYAA